MLIYENDREQLLCEIESNKEFTSFEKKCFLEKDILSLVKEYISREKQLKQYSYSINWKKTNKKLRDIQYLLELLWYKWEITILGYTKRVKLNVNSTLENN